MHSDLAQMESIIAQFLDYARPVEPDRYTDIDLSALVNQVIQEAQRSSDVALQSRVEADLRMRGNAVEIARALSNLIENARRYGKSQQTRQAQIEVNARHDQGRILIEVLDRGIGIPDAQIAYLLRPFTRMDSARSEANGAGLGLAIVDRIVQRHRGQLDIKNREGGGLAVRLSLTAAD